MRRRLLTILSFIALLIILLMMNFTTPLEIGPFGVLVFFTMIYIALFGAVAGIFSIFHKILRKNGKLSSKDYLYTTIIAFGPIMMLLLESFGIMSVFAAVSVVIFVGLGCFLVNKRF